MPMLNWMGREKAAKATKDVVMKILREEKELSYRARNVLTQSRRVAEKESAITGALPQTPNPDNPVNPVEKNTSASLRLCVEKNNADNILVHGDNLEALKALLPFYAGEVKCIYIDPPYNTGSAFEHYDDNLEHSTWLNMMYPRLKLLREFMREDGSIYSVAEEKSGYFSLPDGVTAGDKVYRSEMSFVFVNKQGKAYYSLNMVSHSRNRDETDKEFMYQALLLVDGIYGNKQGKGVTIDATYQVLTIGEGVEEPITEVKEYTSGGVTYMEIATGKRRWYVRPTATGIDVYQAAKPKVAKGKKVKPPGKTLTRTMSLHFGVSPRFPQGSGRFQMLSYGIMPLMQLARKYYPQELIKVLSEEMSNQEKHLALRKLAATM